MKLKGTTWLEMTRSFGEAATAVGRLTEREARRRVILAVCALYDLIPRQVAPAPKRPRKKGKVRR